MEGLQGRKRWRGEEGRKEGAGKGWGEACTNEPRKSVRARYPCAEKTYLQRLNKTSLCQTIQGMAGHSLCGVEGWRKEGGGVRRRVRGGGRRKRDEREGSG